MDKKKIIMICTAAVAVLYIMAVVLTAGVIGIVGETRMALSCHSVRVDREMYAYWQAQQRYQYAKEHGITRPEQWSHSAADGTDRTHDEAANDYVRNYVAAVIVSAHLFEESGYSLTEDQRDAVNEAMDAVVTFAFDGSKKAYNKAAKVFGFDLDAAKRAEMLVKKQTTLVGDTIADALQQDAYYAADYVRVKIVCVKEGANSPEVCESLRFDLNKQESEEALENGTDAFSGAVDSPLNADLELRKHVDGYCFGKKESFTEEMREKLPEVVDAVFEIDEIGGWREVTVDMDVTNDAGENETERRTYFIRRYPLEQLLYLETTDEETKAFFEDFYTNACLYYYGKLVDTYMDDVKWKEKHLIAWNVQWSDSELWKLF